MVASSTLNGDVYDLLKCDANLDFYTNEIANSFIQASLKDKRIFVIKNYTIRGRKSDCGMLQSWKLEGQKASDDEWIELDNHWNEPFRVLQVKTFDVSCKEKLKAVKLTQTGKNSDDWNILNINAFDIFGTVYEP